MIRLKNLLIESTLSTDTDFREKVKSWEGPGPTDSANNHLAYDDANPRKAVIPGQPVRGTLTIGYGTTDSVLPGLKPGMKISPQQAEQLLTKGISEHETKARRLISKYDSYPKYVRAAILNAIYRGDLGPVTIKTINSGQWDNVATKYLQHPNFTNPGKFRGVVARMQSNADAFNKYAAELKKLTTRSQSKTSPTGISWIDKTLAKSVYVVKPGDTLLKIALDHQMTLDDIKSINGLTSSNNIKPGDKIKLK
jgi:GH24 family phage-related lysozyme (muramidase)